MPRTHLECVGYKVSPEYVCWQHIKARCLKQWCKTYPLYGGRGISVCAEWRDSFEAFLKSVGRRPTPKHTLDRINNNGNYEPGNVRWALRHVQMRNTRKNRNITLNGTTLCLKEWAQHFDTTYQAIQGAYQRGETLEYFAKGYHKIHYMHRQPVKGF